MLFLEVDTVDMKQQVDELWEANGQLELENAELRDRIDELEEMIDHLTRQVEAYEQRPYRGRRLHSGAP
jgi:regulator of replication initiation timing